MTASGKIVFGSSLDYAPFESYDQYFQPTGFDIALAREIGGRILILHAGHSLTREQQDRGVGFFDLMREDLVNLRDGLGCR